MISSRGITPLQCDRDTAYERSPLPGIRVSWRSDQSKKASTFGALCFCLATRRFSAG